jgi:CheY-like chemotaxis protein
VTDFAELAHNLKTPISVISGYAELLATREDSETRLIAAKQISAAARRLTEEVDALVAGETNTASEPPGPSDPAHRPGGRARIVVIDDDAGVRQLLRSTLPVEDFEIAEAGDGDVALALAEVQRPDLVLLDWRMPNIPGETVLTELKQRFADIAVVILTVEEDQRGRAEELGADAFLTKPFSPIELLRTVERLLSEPLFSGRHGARTG